MPNAVADVSSDKEWLTTEPAGSPAPRLYYGWVMLPISMAALIASSPGQTFGVSIFNESMRLSLGLSHGQLAAAYTIGTVLGAIPITFIGWLMDRYGLRLALLVVVTLFSGACLATSQVTGWFTLVAAFCLLRMLGPGALSFLSGNVLAFWFERRLGMMEGLRQLGMALAMLLIPILNLWLVTTYGWRGAYVFFGAVIWLGLFPAVFLLFRNRPHDVGQHVDGAAPLERSGSQGLDLDSGFTVHEAVRTSAFWIVTAGTAAFGMIHTAVFFCLVPILAEQGLSETDVAGMLVTFAGCLAVMQFVGGTLADLVRARWLLALGLGGLAAAGFALLFCSTPLAAKVAGAIFGASQGLFFGASHPLLPRYFGRRHLGKIRGLFLTAIVSCSSLGPLFAGLIRDSLGGFDIALWVFALTPLPIALIALTLTEPTKAS